MDSDRFDGLTRSVSRHLSRRSLAASLGVAALGIHDLAEARKKKRKKRRKVKFNEFGCVNVGKFCKNDDQCCSGNCTGSTCRAHDASTCVDGDTSCGLANIPCTTTLDENGRCFTTTGNAHFCGADGAGSVACFTCTRDADCVPDFGEGSACVLCTQCEDNNFVACARLTVP
jgi:hypothetical protein